MLICIMGPAGSGKSTLAKRLEQIRPDRIARVPVDFFFVPRPPTEQIEDYFRRPLEYDWAAVDRAVATAGPERSTPDCDFTTFRWRSPNGGMPIGPGAVLALDGMRPHPKCDRLVLLDIDPHIQQQRLIERDRRWNSAVAMRTAHLAATFAAGLAEIPRQPDLILSAIDPVDRNAAAVLDLLASCDPACPTVRSPTLPDS